MKRHPTGTPQNTSALTGSDLITTLTERANIFLFAYSPQFKSLLSWSDNALAILGVKDVDIARDGNLFLRHVHPDDRYLLMTDLEQALSGKKEYRATYRWIRPDNNQVSWLHCRAGMVHYKDGSVFEGLLVDLSDEFTGAIGQLAGPDSVGTILSAISTLVFTVDQDMRLVRINRADTAKSFNFGDLNFKHEQFRIGRSMLAGFADPEIKQLYSSVMHDLLKGKLPYYRNRIAHAEIVYSIEIVPLTYHEVIEGLLFNISDISESVNLERQISQLQRTEGLARLAAGVAHNFNNALQGIIGQAAILSHHSDNPELVKQAGNSIIDIVNRTSDLTRQLMIFHEPVSEKPPEMDLNLAAMAAINNVQDIFSNGIKIAVAFSNPSKVRAQQSQIVEAVEALLHNAKESFRLPTERERTISIKTSEVQLQPFEVHDLPSGQYAKLVISDSGVGMSAEEVRRCLDPFFTTKERDRETGIGIKSSGLGLSKVFAIARKFQGALTIDSKEGQGTKVALYLPVSEAAPEQNDKVIALPRKREVPEILVIDDDAMVLDTVSTILKDLGFNPVGTSDAQAGLELLRSHYSTIKLVLLDAVMPGMDGLSVLKEIRRINKSIPVVGFSGAAQEYVTPMINAGATEILRKPVGPRELESVIKRILTKPVITSIKNHSDIRKRG